MNQKGLSELLRVGAEQKYRLSPFLVHLRLKNSSNLIHDFNILWLHSSAGTHAVNKDTASRMYMTAALSIKTTCVTGIDLQHTIKKQNRTLPVSYKFWKKLREHLTEPERIYSYSFIHLVCT